MDELERIQALLEQARRRVESATPHSPEWDAAMDAVDDLERRLRDQLRVLSRADATA